MSDVLCVGMIGAGGIARSHMNAIAQNDNIRVVGVMDIDAGRAGSAAGEHGARAYTDLDALLADSEVEGVIVCTPHNQHGDQVVAAAEAGKHVLVEKPMALTVEACDRMIAACDRANRILMVGQVMRHYPVSRKVKGDDRRGGHRRGGTPAPAAAGQFQSGPAERAGAALVYGLGDRRKLCALLLWPPRIRYPALVPGFADCPGLCAGEREYRTVPRTEGFVYGCDEP